MNILVIVLAILGAFYTFLPHKLHVASGLGFGQSHAVHVIIGITALAIATLVHKSINRSPFDDLTVLATI